LGAENYWIDEMDALLVGRGGVLSIVGSIKLDRPPLFIMALHFWMDLFGTSEAATRSLSAIAGIAALPAMYAVGRELFNARVGLVSTLVLAVSQFQIYQAQSIRYYSFLLLFSLLSYLCFARAMRTGKPLYFALYAVSNVCLFYTHFFGVFVFAAQYLYFFIKRKELKYLARPWLAAQALVLLAASPVLLRFLAKVPDGTANPNGWIPPAELLAPLQSLLVFLFSERDLPPLPAVGLAAALLVAGAGAYLLWRRAGWRSTVQTVVGQLKADTRDKGNELLMVCCWLLCPILLPYLLSFAIGPTYLHRYAIPAAPAFYLLLALVLVSLSRAVPAYVLLGVGAVLVGPGLYDYYRLPVNEQWREAAVYVQDHARPDDAVVLASPESSAAPLRYAYTWYSKGDLKQCDLGVRPELAQETARSLSECVSGAGRFWLIFRGDESDTRRNAYLLSFFSGSNVNAMAHTQTHHFSGLTVYLFERNP
jgi:4-amino-4-deoxy-L-arabinose transferase-like glycosyltransferase